MKNFNSNIPLLRYTGIAVILAFVAFAVLAKGFYIMTVERDYWFEVSSILKYDSIPVDPVRGNILACDGQQLACNIPEYKIFMDFRALKESKADTLWYDSLGNSTQKLDQLCIGLNKLFPEKTADEFKEYLKQGYDKNSRYWRIVKRRIDYTTYQKVKKLPLFNLRKNIGGFAEEKFPVRNRPYGSLAQSVIGDTYKEKGIAFSGLELACDSFLKGHSGYKHRRKVLNGWVDILDSAAVDGCDIITTIDVGIQDLAERALIKELKKDGAYTGVAIVMEVETGDIKAMVNMDLDPNTGEYFEGRNHAIADWLEPGSVFKTASFLVALDDGKIDTSMTINTGCGIKDMYGAKMRDHNWHRGGYGVISVPKALQVSSNIGVSALIDKYYHNRPEEFVKGLHRVGIAENLHLGFSEYMPPRVRMPKKNERGQYTNWSNTALPWMSIGYETNVPPISVVTFYNAIANDGKLVRPRFIKRVEHNGEVIKEYPVQVLKEKIYKNEKALREIQTILYQVVDIGLGKRAGSKNFGVSGKTGTAQKASNGGYKNGTTHYLLSFCGYFPSGIDPQTKERIKPKYSCIVCIQKAGLPASGGLMSGQVFHDISEGIMAKNIYTKLDLSHTTSNTPNAKPKSHKILSRQELLALANKTEQKSKEHTNGRIKNEMPNLIGMGARDAVYQTESRGAKVILKGKGKVRHQSKSAGSTINKGEKIILELG